MGAQLNRKTYIELITKDVAWLMKQPRTLERDHILRIIEWVIEYENDNLKHHPEIYNK